MTSDVMHAERAGAMVEDAGAGREGSGAAPASTGEAPAGGEHRVPVGEAIRYRKRAQDAETRAGALQDRVRELEQTLAQTREALDAVERRGEIDRALVRAEAVDLETARLLTELAVREMDGADVEAAVAELRRRKPFLFRNGVRGRTGSVGAAMSGRTPQAGSDGQRLVEAAEAAARAGDRGALLRYLRARRGG